MSSANIAASQTKALAQSSTSIRSKMDLSTCGSLRLLDLRICHAAFLSASRSLSSRCWDPRGLSPVSRVLEANQHCPPSDWLADAEAERKAHTRAESEHFDGGEHARGECLQSLCSRTSSAVKVDGRTHYAHKVILAASIPYFEDLLLGGDYDEKETTSIPPSSETVEALLTFAYSGLRPQSCAAATEDFLPSTVDDVHVDALFQQRFAKFDHFRGSEKLCDFTFMIGDSVFCAHKIILAASIPFFADLFLNPNESSILDYTVLNRLAPRAVQAVLQFAYSGVFDPTSAMQEEGSNLRDIILAAKLFQVEKLEVACLDFLRQRLDFDVVQQYWSFAHANDLFELQEMLQSYVCANFQEFIGTPAFLALTAAELEDFLVRDDLSVTNENDIFRAIVSWVYNERAQRPSSLREVVNIGRAEAFPRLFSRLRLCKLSKDFAEQILSHLLCRAHFDCTDLTLETKLLRMTLMLKEQEVISRGAQSDRVYRELSTDVLFTVKRDENVETESALVEIFNPIENTWQEFCSMHVCGNPRYVILNSKRPSTLPLPSILLAHIFLATPLCT
nr:unnamed protein product [Spirometra erinaceieuropaei]